MTAINGSIPLISSVWARKTGALMHLQKHLIMGNVSAVALFVEPLAHTHAMHATN
jgi:hypothetical protein